MTIDNQDADELIPVKEACDLLGGFHTATYRRGANAGRYPPILHPSPNIARVSKREVLKTRERIIAEGEAAT
jgi:hypothetical protein